MRRIDSAPLVNQKLPSGPSTTLPPSLIENAGRQRVFPRELTAAAVMRPTLPISRNARPVVPSEAMATGNADAVRMV